MQRLLKPALFALALLLSACATDVRRSGSADQKLSLSVEAVKRVTLDVQGNKEMTASRDWEQFRNEWRIGMQEATAAAGMVLVGTDAAFAPTAEPTTLVTVRITDYRYITRGARVLVGIMTGNAFINADVSFVELPGATPAGSRRYSTTSSAAQGVFAPMTENQIRGISDEIVKDVARR